MSKISVVISAFNAANYIGETLESVLGQDYHDLEVIVVDDASMDQTEAVVRRFPADRIRFSRLTQNSGYAAKPRNVGIRMATGEVVATCDADDLLAPGSLSARMALLEKESGLGLVFCDGVRFHEDGRTEPGTVQQWRTHFASIPRREVGRGQFVIASADAYHGLAVGNFVTPSGTLFPRDTFDDVGYFDESLGNGDDLDMYFRVARRRDIGYVDTVGYRYRLHAGSISHRKASLAVSKIRVLERQLALDPALATRRELLNWIAGNYVTMGYLEQAEGRMRVARRHYLKSLAMHRTLAGFRGLLLTLLSRRLYLWLRRHYA
jgi:glycosyltransferase involved in cell wall biosynthesis